MLSNQAPVSDPRESVTMNRKSRPADCCSLILIKRTKSQTSKIKLILSLPQSLVPMSKQLLCVSRNSTTKKTDSSSDDNSENSQITTIFSPNPSVASSWAILFKRSRRRSSSTSTFSIFSVSLDRIFEQSSDFDNGFMPADDDAWIDQWIKESASADDDCKFSTSLISS